MHKSLLLVPLALLAFAPLSAAEPAHRSIAVSASPAVDHDARGAWFRQSVGNILEGRATAPQGGAADQDRR